MPLDRSKTQTECWFLDVGEGTANVILLGQRRAIVVDCGPYNSRIALKFLKRYVDTIEALIISHNDSDHDGGVADILQSYPKAINNVYFLMDRHSRLIRTWMVAKHELDVGNLLNAPLRLEARDKPQIIYSDRDTNIELKIAYPYFPDNLQAEDTARPNRTSAILYLHCGTRSIVFSGDATIEAWESIAMKFANRLPLHCDAMTIPHHGGRISNNSKKEQEYLRRLYSEIITPQWGIISTGTSNQYGHPSSETISVLRSLDIGILCTQITSQCSDDLESIRPGLVQPLWPSQSTSFVRTTQSKRSKDVACVGTIVAEVSPERVIISFTEHLENSINRLIGSDKFHPLCRQN